MTETFGAPQSYRDAERDVPPSGIDPVTKVERSRIWRCPFEIWDVMFEVDIRAEGAEEAWAGVQAFVRWRLGGGERPPGIEDWRVKS